MQCGTSLRSENIFPRRALVGAIVVASVFYIIAPMFYLASSLSSLEITKSLLLALCFGLYFPAYLKGYRSSPIRSEAVIKIASVNFLVWFCCAILFAQILDLGMLGANPFLQPRNHLYELREGTQGQLQSFAAFGCASLSGLAVRDGQKRAPFIVASLLVLTIEFLTLSRGFITILILSYLLVGRSVRLPLFVLSLTFAIILIRFFGSSGGGSFLEASSYFMGETLNIWIGVMALNESEFEITALQSLRPVIGVIPGLGRVLDIESESVKYNFALREYFGMYGHAFGVVGFAKFSSFLGIFVFSSTTIFSVLLVGYFRFVSPTIFLAVLSGAMASFFRWSPGEAMSLFFRVIFLLYVAHLVTQTFFPIRKSGAN